MERLKTWWNDIKGFVDDLLGKVDEQHHAPKYPIDPEQQKKATEEAERFYLKNVVANDGIVIVRPKIPEWKTTYREIITKETLDKLRLARFNNPLAFTNTPTVSNKSKYIVTPILMSQYLESIKHYESNIGAQYHEDSYYESEQRILELMDKINCPRLYGNV